MNQRLRDAIQALLSAHLRGLLLAADARTPVLGSTSIARPDGRETSTIPDAWVIKYLYHGWLAWNASNPAPRVYSASTLTSYLLSSGTLIPGSSPARNEYLIGRAKTHRTETCIPGAKKPTFDLAPELDDDDSYAWPMSRPPEPDGVEIWTGEARLMDQALRGAGRTWSHALGNSGLSYGSRKTAIFFDADGGIWASEVDAGNGLRVVQLSIPAPLNCLLEWLVDPDIADSIGADGRALLRAWLFAYASAPAGGTVHQLLTQSQINPAFANGAASLHPLCNWQWRWQPALDSPIQAVVVATRYTSNYYYSRSSTMTVTVTAGVPSATISVGGETQWGGTPARVVVPTGNGIAIRVLPSGTLVSNTSAVIYKFTTTNGGITTVTRGAINTGNVGNSGTSNYPSFCGLGSQTNTYITAQSFTNAGYQLSGGTTLDSLGRIYEQDLSTTYKATVVAAGSYTPPDDGNHDITISASCAAGENSGVVTGYGTVYKSVSTTEYESFSLSSGYGHRVLCILPTDNGVAVGWRQGGGSGWYTYGILANDSGSSGYQAYKATVTRRPPYNDSYTSTFTATPGQRLGIATVNNGPYFNSGFRTPGVTQTRINGEVKRSLKICPSDGSIKTLTGIVFNTIFSETAYTTGTGPRVITSWTGAVAYSPTDTTMSYPDGLSSDISTYNHYAPAGWA